MNLALAFERSAHERKVMGHAWVEVDNTPLLERRPSKKNFIPLVKFNSNGARRNLAWQRI